MKKFVSFLLVFAIMASLGTGALAISTADERKADAYDAGYVYIVDDEGNQQALWVEERTYYMNRNLRTSTRAADYEVGDKKEITVQIPNSKISATATLGGALGSTAKATLGKLAADAVVAKIGSTFVGGVAVATTIVGAIGAINHLVFDNEGFEVTITMKWAHFVNHKEGIDEYNWSFAGVSIDTY